MKMTRLSMLLLALVMSLVAVPGAFGKGPVGGTVTDQKANICGGGMHFVCGSGDEICCYASDEHCLYACEVICDGPCDGSSEA